MTAKWEKGGIFWLLLQSLNLDPSHVSSILRQGEPKDVVCQVADEINADLIIMGSRGLKAPTVDFIKLGQSVRFPVVFSPNVAGKGRSIRQKN